MVDRPKLDLHIYDVLPSTSSHLLSLSERKNLASGYAVQALKQSEGRGRYDRKWTSYEGNMALSLYLKPTVPPNLQSQIAFVCAVAMARTLIVLGVNQSDIKLKWPNDVLVNEKKISGILIERANKGIVIGTGFNIVAAPEDKTCLNAHIKEDVELQQATETYLEELLSLYTVWENEGFQVIRDEWLRFAWRLNEKLHIKLRNKNFHGIFKDLDLTGALIVKHFDTGIEEKITSAEIY